MEVLWLEKILPILDEIDKLSDIEKKDLLKILPFDFGEKTEMERRVLWLLWMKNLLSILNKIDKLSDDEKKALFELLSIDLVEKDKVESLNWDIFDEEMLRILIHDITSNLFASDTVDELFDTKNDDLFELLSIDLKGKEDAKV